jgi:multiple sugar transport system permease protein
MRGISQNRVGYAFLAPWLLGFVALTLAPMVASLLLSCCRWSGHDLRKIQWVGGANYREVLRGAAVGGALDAQKTFGVGLIGDVKDTGDLDVYLALKNTIYYSLLSVPLGLCVALALAMLLNQQLRGIGLFRTFFYMPHIIGGVATIMMWMWVFNPNFGLLNAGLRAAAGPLMDLGLVGRDWQPPGWIYSAQWSKPAFVIMSLWGTGGAMLIFLAALQNVPEQLYEAARIDGAGRAAQFRHITLPQISPAIFFNLIMGIIGTFQVFDSAYIMTGGNGGPSKSLLFYVLYLYNKAFVDYEMGYASALAWVLFAIILALTMLVLGSSRSWVYYEGDRK